MMNNRETGGPPWEVKYHVWEKSDEANDSRRSGHTGEQRTFSGFFNEPTPIDCVNAIVYELRGAKSKWELAYVDYIRPAQRGDG